MEEKERLLALDKDITDEEDEEIAKEFLPEKQEKRDPFTSGRMLPPWERKLVCVDETSKVLI